MLVGLTEFLLHGFEIMEELSRLKSILVQTHESDNRHSVTVTLAENNIPALM